MAAADLHPLEASLLARIEALGPSSPGGLLAAPDALALFRCQATSRIIDHVARELRADGLGYYTIGSAGHESNAAVAMALRLTDPAMLHYRSGAFYLARAAMRTAAGHPHDGVDDILRGMLAKATEPIAGGRHKVFGHVDLHVIPQTSTIASQLPRAVGLAISIGNAARDQPGRWPPDSVVLCSFGDASLNHSTGQGAFNWAEHAAGRGQRVPIIFMCEDNGLGISVPTPPGWVESVGERYVEFEHASADGRDPGAVHAAALRLAESARAGRPGFLHLKTVRYLGHAGSDVEAAYRSPASLRADEARDPLAGAAQAVVDAGGSGAELAEWYRARRAEVAQRARALADEPELETAEQVMVPIAWPKADEVRRAATQIASATPADAPRTVAQSINDALAEVLDACPEALVFGEDVARKGGVYGVTRGLQRQFGPRRVFDTLLDEQSILGLALGASLNGFLPIPEIQYLAYLHNAEDQIRGEAATLQFFSQRAYANPMVVRIAAYAYQRGFGGHFHNDNSIAVLRDIPGLVIASPSHPCDAGPMLRSCVAAGLCDGTVSVFLEPIARYHTADLHEEGDRGWLGIPHDHVDIGRAAVHGDGTDVTLVSWGNGAYLCRQAQARLERDGIAAQVVDLRWIAPLPVDDLLRAAAASGRVLVVDETRKTGGAGEGIVAALVDGGFGGQLRRISARDSFVPLGDAADLVLVQVDDIVDTARDMLAKTG